MTITKAQKAVVRTYLDLNVYQQSYALAMKVYEMAKTFPSEEKYSLATQMIRSSRSVPSNICEGWTKRKYKNIFIRHLVDANGSCEEMKVWLNFAKDCAYVENKTNQEIRDGYDEVGRMLHSLIKNWRSF